MSALAINPASASLPQSYEAAKRALTQCVEIDECKDWADKAAALASYAKQADDDQLERMATRIRGRAVRRAGELLKQIEPVHKGNSNTTYPSDMVGHVAKSRSEMAREAGFSEHQQTQAVRVASIPQEDFERQIESEKPPTISQLASQGIKPRPLVDLKGRDPKHFNAAMHFVGEFEHVRSLLAKQDVASVLPILNDSERARLRAAINAIDAINDSIITRI
jgi:hypothetical protein